MKPKKILLLGGAFFQIPSIEAVKRMGHYAITCDYRPDNPGHRLADEYHNGSTSDREGVLVFTQKRKNDSVVCCLCDPSAFYRSHRPLSVLPLASTADTHRLHCACCIVVFKKLAQNSSHSVHSPRTSSDCNSPSMPVRGSHRVGQS